MSKPQIIVRVEKHGQFKNIPFGVYAEKENRGDMVDRVGGHSSYDEGWYKGTKPATAEQEAEFCEWYERSYGQCDLVKRRA